MFLNFSNHPAESWQKKQFDVASIYGEVIDLPFPQIDPATSSEDVEKLARVYIGKVINMKPDVVFVAGEFTFTYLAVKGLLRAGIRVVSSCSVRQTVEITRDDGTMTKSVHYDFVQFRDYSDNI
ncbi:MAG: hypothetical protein PHX95_10010 [Lachnospiraceae bacterium]|nr:hypothetical protein [Lachnospiraceae bacterium]MDD4526156.1 hypothetical protein [Lachnospiraceae bacterium]NLC73767.1 CRISPR-associated protein [Clostridiales bacterium]